MSITVSPHPQSRPVKCHGFVDYNDGRPGHLGSWTEMSGVPSVGSKRLCELLREREILLWQAAEILGLTVVQVSDLRRGRVLPDQGWDAVYEALANAGGGL